MKAFVGVVGLVVLAMATSVSAVTTVTTADANGADSCLYYFNQGGNYGDVNSFMISKDHVPYIKLDLSSIGANTITDANFSLYANPGYDPVPSYDYQFAIFGVLDGSDDWEEATIQYNNAPVVTNPITWHPRLRYLGRVNYSTSGPDLVTMQHTGGKPLNDFLNNRGPDNHVTLIIASSAVTEQRFFSTKEDHGDGSEAPFVTFEISSTPTQFNTWVGTDSNDWHDPDNWINESGSADVPDANAIVNIAGGSNLPVVIDANAQAKKVFIHAGGLNLSSGTLNISDGVLRVKDGVQVDVTDGQAAMAGNVEGYMWGIIGAEKIITSLPCQQEVYAEAIDVNDGNNIVTTTWIKTRDLERRLSWANSIVDADGTLKWSGLATPPPQSRSATYCVDRSGMVAPEAHIGSIAGGVTVPGNYYCAYQIYPDIPVLKFEFDGIYNLTEMLVWNYELSYALNKVKIEYSTNDSSYTTLQDGGSDYFYLDFGNKLGTKNDVIDFGGAAAKYVKITAVGGPGTGNHETTNWGTYILREVQFRHDGSYACEPDPANNDTTVNTDVQTLSWIPGHDATVGQDVWFGTDPCSLTLIGDDIAPCQDSIEIPNSISITSDTQYYWRVDSNDGGGAVAGRLWTFSTRPYISFNPGGEGIIFSFGIKTSGGSKGYLATNGSDITGDIRTALSDSTMWYCNYPAGVGVNEPELYIEFDKIYDLNEMWVWNYPSGYSSSAMAWKTIEIDYSTDGVNYSALGTTYVLPQGNADGTHDTEIAFGVPARYVRIRAVGGPGVGTYGASSYRLCEVRFYADGAYTSVKAYDPAPAENSEVDVFTELSWTPGTASVSGQDIWFGPTGSMVKIADNVEPNVSSYTFSKPLDNYTEYSWRVDGIDGNAVTTGDTWTFDTRARLRFNPVVIGIVDGNYSPGNGGSAGTLAVDWSGLTYDSHYSGTDTSIAGYNWSSDTWYCRKPWDVGVTEPNIIVEFDRIYDINEMWIWNHDGMDNTSGDNEYNIAVQDIKVEYSTNGTSYTTLDTYTLPHGDPEGWHDTEIDFGGASAKYVKITLLSNYGSTTWGYKLREIRFYYEVPLWTDLDASNDVDFKDFATIAADWLDDNWTGEDPIPCPGKPGGDVNGDCKVDEQDIDWLAWEWLETIN